MIKMNKFSKVLNVHFQEIPSFHTNDDGEFYLAHGLHVVITYGKNKHFQFFISSEYKTMYQDYKLSPVVYSVYDMLAFHVYRYMRERCYFNGTKWKVLYYLLRQSNGRILALKKFIDMLVKFNR